MRNSLDNHRITVTELTFLLIGALLILLLGALVAKGQSQPQGAKVVRAQAQAAGPLYREYRGVRLGMTAAEVRAKLGEPTSKSDEQDFYIFPTSETAQFAYNAAQKVTVISADYSGNGAPDYRSVLGEVMLEQKADGSVFRMMMYDSERFWVSYYKSAATVPIVTITIGAYK
jgi:outer membrane protein assembly factor BamE (lipoprotein component of BamABCDE complex)